jgi:anti-anti-sigma regulatory factor
MALGPQVSVTRVGTQVVVRLSGELGDDQADALQSAMDDVMRMASRLVAVDLSGAQRVDGVAIDFLATLNGRWQVRHLNTPPHLRGLRSTLRPGPAPEPS